MAGRGYERLDIYQFGAHLLESGDLDPLYIALHKAELPPDQRDRWLVAYWCFYSAGLASWLSSFERQEYWDRLYTAADNKTEAPPGGRYERGSERRHFRGSASLQAVLKLRSAYPEPECVVRDILARSGQHGARRVEEVMQAAQRLPLFGPWIAFKIADMTDRVLEERIVFDNAAVFMFDSPREAAFLLWRKLHGFSDTVKPKDDAAVLNGVVEHLIDKFKDFSAPPLHDRAVNLQEIETILCKWKSHLNGHYPLNNDIEEINHALDRWDGHSETARLLRACMPKPKPL